MKGQKETRSTANKKLQVVYWCLLICTAIGFFLSAFKEITLDPATLQKTTEHLGYPEYFLTLLGTAKLLAIAALLQPRFPTLKEWAYAGLSFDVISAIWSEIAVGNPSGSIQGFAVGAALAVTYVLYRMLRSRKQDASAAPYSPAAASNG
jgi:hypothetical protein